MEWVETKDNTKQERKETGRNEGNNKKKKNTEDDTNKEKGRREKGRKAIKKGNNREINTKTAERRQKKRKKRNKEPQQHRRQYKKRKELRRPEERKAIKKRYTHIQELSKWGNKKKHRQSQSSLSTPSVAVNFSQVPKSLAGRGKVSVSLLPLTESNNGENIISIRQFSARRWKLRERNKERSWSEVSVTAAVQTDILRVGGDVRMT